MNIGILTQESAPKVKMIAKSEDSFQKKTLIMPIVIAAVMVTCSRLPLAAYGEKTGLALGVFISLILCYLVQPWDMVLSTLMVPVAGYFLGFWDWSVIQTSTGTSSFVSMFALSVVSAGAATTPLGRRIALIFLRKFHDKPLRMVFAVSIVSAALSAFISNTAVIIMMSGIVNGLLLTMGEKPGESKIGRVMMVLIVTASYVGGMALINGCSASALLGIGMLESATDGQFTITYRQFAAIGVPGVLLTIVPVCLLYIKGMGLKSSDFTNLPSRDYYQALYDDLGPVQGCEIRWALLTVFMVVWLFLGGHSTAVPLVCAIITLLPVVGTVPVNKMFDYVPMKILFIILFAGTIGSLLTTTGLSALFTAHLSPLFEGLSPYVFILVVCLVMSILENICVTVNTIYVLVMTLVTPICISMGYNPSLMMLPVLMLHCTFFVLRLNATVLVNKHYGWWETKDGVLPGIVSVLILCIVFPALALLIGPAIGMPLYIGA